MVNDLDEAETVARNHQGFENDEIGVLLIRLIRHVRALTATVADLRQRVETLEAASK